ncbi:hypothetical protein Scani_56750 [Streptomyces caniferus]|uniref:Uncharacterized protein n=1 Tax=Streptomyces caniferus TaxID=285557 RepID=A0A640SE03_9ACTN|nr:hypothetical protein Scani_56750 [Streptomyces caniferus]
MPPGRGGKSFVTIKVLCTMVSRRSVSAVRARQYRSAGGRGRPTPPRPSLVYGRDQPPPASCGEHARAAADRAAGPRDRRRPPTGNGRRTMR